MVGRLKVTFCFEVEPTISSKELWDLISSDGINIIDTISSVYVYGRTSLDTFLEVLSICKEHGTIIGGELK